VAEAAAGTAVNGADNDGAATLFEGAPFEVQRLQQVCRVIGAQVKARRSDTAENYLIPHENACSTASTRERP
jgi:hypothetical protein